MDLINNFNQIKNTLGKTPTTSEMKQHGQFSVSTYESRFGTWNKFLQSQGVNPVKRHTIPKGVFEEELRKVVKVIGKVPNRAEFEKHSGISSNSVRRTWGNYTNFLKSQNVTVPDYSNKALIAEYWDLKRYLRKEKSLTVDDINKHSHRYSSSTYERRYGGWGSFLQSIGETPNVNANITKGQLLDDYHRVARLINKKELSSSDIREHSKYSLSTYIDKFGSWNQCKKRARVGRKPPKV